jgi:hypothetical protein
MNIVKMRGVKGNGFNLLRRNGTVRPHKNKKIAGMGISEKALEEIESGTKGITSDIVRKFEGLRIKPKTSKKSYISF